MLDISAWLKTLDLEEYAELFHRHRIDWRVLPDLTDQDLRELGIAALGHRKLLLREIAALGADMGGSTTTALMPGQRGEGAERRQLTILFCDLVGSTQLSQRLDPETLRDLMKRYQQGCRAVFEKFDGHVAQYLGDGMMVYFGWPRAHEDDAERATRAALEILHAMKAVHATAPLQVRIGIATGPVVVGETGGGDASVPNIAVGETPNLAARMQGLAAPDEIVIAATTQRLLGRTFEMLDLGAQILKGIVAPVPAFKVVGLAHTEGRFDSMRSPQLTPFVGRELEMSLLAKQWKSTAEGEGQVILLCGEAGIGKSRIMEEFLSQLSAQSHQRQRYQCSPFHTNSAFHPLVEQLQRSALFSTTDDNAARLSKLETAVRRTGASSDTDIALMASLLGVDVEGRYPSLNFSPQRQKEETILALCQRDLSLNRHEPSLLIVEDAHWIDASTLEWLDALVPRLSKARVMMIVTFRPEFKPRWTEHDHTTLLTLKRLGRREADAMAMRIGGGKALPQELLAHIVAKTDGVPLFVEEMTKAFLEGDLLEESAEGFRLKRSLSDLSIPSTLQDSLMSRLDRLTTSKEVAQIGACIGREFSVELLTAAASMPSRQISDALTQLVDAGLIHRSGQSSGVTYTFKHALVQDVAYQSILKSNRARIHTHIATTLLERSATFGEKEPETIAHHFTAAGLHERAVPFWFKAGQHALGRMALPESIGHLRKALEWVAVLPPAPERDAQELDIRITLAAAFLAYGGWAYVELPSTLEPALALANHAPDKRLVVLYFLWLYHWVRSNTGEASQLAHELVNKGQSEGHVQSLIVGLAAQAMTECFMGEWKSAQATGERFLALYTETREASLVPVLNQDIKCLLLTWSPFWNGALGYPEQARKDSLEGLDLARRVGHPFNLIWTLTGGTCGLLVAGDTSTALEWNEEAREIARKQSMAFLDAAPCNFWGSQALIIRGEFEQGFEMSEIGMRNWIATGGICQIPLLRNMQAYALGKLGRTDEGMQLIEATLKETERTNHRTWEPESHRVHAELLMMAGRLDEAPAAIGNALRIARAKEALGFELTATTTLVRLERLRGERGNAQVMLRDIYDRFTEGFDTPSLADARALLDG